MGRFNETLIELFNGIDEMFHCQTIDKKTPIKLYSLVYDHCTSNSSCSAESELSITATGRQKYFLEAGLTANGRFVGGILYYDIENYLISYMEYLYQMSENMSNEDLLQFYTDQWDKYRKTINALQFVFSYLHRHWIQVAHIRGFKSIHEINILTMLIWQEVFLKPTSNRLTNICFNMIETERQHQFISNIHLIKNIIESYMAFNFDHDMSMWLNEEMITVSAVDMYKEYFEVPFLENTKRFYRIVANEGVNESLVEYLMKVARYLNGEEYRVDSYLRLSLTQSYLTMIEEILIHDHLNDVCDEVRNILNRTDYQDLKRLFEPIKQIPMMKKELKPIIKDHVYQIGYQSIEEMSTTAINDPRIFVKTIIEIHEKFSQFIQDIFLNDSIFVDAFNQACAEFINSNAMTNAGKNSSALLAQYCNKILRNNNKILQESEFEKNFSDIMIVFDYIEDKDTFELWYRKFFSKRLINQQSISSDYEEMMISKLKQICGVTYTSILEKMLQDINLSQDFMDQYQIHCQDEQIQHAFHFSAMILSSNSWRLSSSTVFILPKTLQSVLTDFTGFYKSRREGRTLALLPKYSTGELEMFSIKQKYILQVSTYQMMVLLLFNESTEWTVEQIQNKTGLNLELLRATFYNLIKSKILISDDNEINANSTVRIAEDFRNNKIRINLNVPLNSVEQKEIEDVNQTIDEDRKMGIQAAIIRIMKASQTLKHALLMREVIQQLSSLFRPEISIIKKCIDILIEKEYLERDAKENEVLHYLN